MGAEIGKGGGGGGGVVDEGKQGWTEIDKVIGM